MIPISIFHTWLPGLLSFGMIGVIFRGHEWQQRSWGWDPVLQKSVFGPNFGSNEETAFFAIAVA